MRKGRIASVIAVTPLIASGAARCSAKRLRAAAAVEVARTLRQVGRFADMTFTALRYEHGEQMRYA
jgi:hypothetical protein